jgi:hypothetical protein
MPLSDYDGAVGATKQKRLSMKPLFLMALFVITEFFNSAPTKTFGRSGAAQRNRPVNRFGG